MTADVKLLEQGLHHRHIVYRVISQAHRLPHYITGTSSTALYQRHNVYRIISQAHFLPHYITGASSTVLYHRHIVYRIIWNPEIHCRIHKSQPPFRIHIRINLVYGHPFHFSNIHFNIIPLSTLRSYTWSHFLRFPHHSSVSIALPHMCCRTRPSHLPRFDYPNNTGLL
jgi:hypothetical protein